MSITDDFCQKLNIQKGKYIKCKVCGKRIYLYPYLIKSGRKKYCSNKCKHIAMKKVAKEKGFGKHPNSLKNLEKMTSKRAKELGFGKWMKGKKLSKAGRKKISESLKKVKCETRIKEGQHLSMKTEFKKGDIPWSYKKTKEIDKRILAVSGENHYNWKGGITSEIRKQREKFNKNYSPKVFERDDYTCQICGKRGVKLQAHHLKSWGKYPELRFELDNCQTVCTACHYLIHFKKQPDEKSMRFGCWK